jgi:transcriptional regulator with XRE-family HTH domain
MQEKSLCIIDFFYIIIYLLSCRKGETMELLQGFGNRVRRQRMQLGLSQVECAKKAGIPVPVLSRIEHGHQSIYLDRLIALAQALHVSTDYLLGLTDDKRPHSRRGKASKPDADTEALTYA